jgi:hypothetical protein
MWELIVLVLVGLGLLGVSLTIVGVKEHRKQPTKLHGQVIADLGVALCSGVIVALFIFIATNDAEERRATQADALEDQRAARSNRLENTRFVRSVASEGAEALREFDQLDLRGQFLNGLDLRRASLNEARLTEATLYTAQLGGADLMDADLQCTRMFGASFEGDPQTLLRRAKFHGADMRFVRFGNADLLRAEFGQPDGYPDIAHATDLRYADLSAVENIDTVDWGEGVIYNLPEELTEDQQSRGLVATKWPQGFTLPNRLPLPDPDDTTQGPRCRPFQFRLTE